MGSVPSPRSFPTLIHERVYLCNKGANPKAIARLPSGWVVLGDDQRIPGYVLLLSDPVVPSLASLEFARRSRFLLDMSVVGDALLKVIAPFNINYSILGNTDAALHAHIHPRFHDESEGSRRMPPWFYHFQGTNADSCLGVEERTFIREMRKALV